MNHTRLLTLSALITIAGGCKRDATFTEPMPELAAIHWVNAVPDTGAQDMHLVDIPSNAGIFGATFRDTVSGANMFYQPVEAGSRTIRVFLAAGTGNPAVASTVLTEATVTLDAGKSYTFIHQGFARTGQNPPKEGFLVTDNPPAPAAGQIAVRIISAAAGLGNVDVWIVKRAVNAATADSLPDTRAVTDMAYKTVGTYLASAIDGAGEATRVVVTATGTKTPILASVIMPAGVVGTATADPIAGRIVAGSVFTAVVLPRSVAGSQAPNVTTPGVMYLVDKRPPSTYQ